MKYLRGIRRYRKGGETLSPVPEQPDKCYKTTSRARTAREPRGEVMDHTLSFKCDITHIDVVVGPPYGAVLLLRESKFVAIGVNPVDELPASAEGYAYLCAEGAWVVIQAAQPDFLFVVDKSECIATVPLTAVPEAIAERAVLCYAFATKAFGGDYPAGFVVPPLIPATTLLDETTPGD